MVDFNDASRSSRYSLSPQAFDAVLSKKLLPMNSSVGRKYGMIPTDRWISPEQKAYRQLPAEARDLLNYLSSSPYSNRIGLFRQSLGSIHSEFILASSPAIEPEASWDCLRNSLDRLETVELVRVDELNSYVWVIDQLHYDIVCNHKGALTGTNLKGCINQLMSVPDIPLRRAFIDRYGKALDLQDCDVPF